MPGDGKVYVHCSALADTKDPVGALILDGRVPPAGKVDDMVGSRQRQADAAGAWRQDHHVETRAFLERIDTGFAGFTSHRSVDDEHVLGQ